MIVFEKIVSNLVNIFISFESKYKKSAPFIYTLVSCICFTLTSLFVKFSLTIPPYQSIYSRALVVIALNTIIIFSAKYEIYTKNKKTNDMLLSRGLLGGISLSLFYHALYLVPLSYFAVLQRLSPLWIGLIGAVYFNEPFKVIHLITTILCFIGVILIVKPSYIFPREENSEKQYSDIFLGVVLLLINNIVVAITFLTIRQLKNRTNVVIVVFYSNLINLMTAGLGQFFENSKVLTNYEIFMIVFSSLFSFIGQLCRSRALFLEKAFIISILVYLQLVFGYLSDYFILDSRIDLLGNLGILIIMVATMILLFIEGVNA